MSRILLIIIVLVIILVIYVTSITNSIKIKFEGLTNVNISGLNLGSFGSNQTVIKARILLTITFTSFFRISISSLNIKITKNGLLIANSSANVLENTQKITLSPNIPNQVYQTFDFHINNELIDLITKVKNKQKYTINYLATFKFLGITITKTGIYETN